MQQRMSHSFARFRLAAGMAAVALALWGCAPIPAAVLTPTAAPIAQALSTDTPTAVAPAEPTDTPAPEPTATPTPAPTDTPLPTDTPAPTPIPTDTFTPAPPTETPLPTATPTPTDTPVPPVDWRLVSWRQLTPCENRGGHSLFITVLDAAGNGIPGVPLLIEWTGGSQVVYTGDKPDRGPGCTDFPMYGGYTVRVAEGTSDVTPVLSSHEPESQRCDETNDNVANSYGHYSYEVIFQRTH
jgi:hypothetical protein